MGIRHPQQQADEASPSIIASFMGAGFVYCHRRYVMFMRGQHIIKRVLTKWWVIVLP